MNEIEHKNYLIECRDAKIRSLKEHIKIHSASVVNLRAACKALLDCPDLNLDELEPATIEAIQAARDVLAGS